MFFADHSARGLRCLLEQLVEISEVAAGKTISVERDCDVAEGRPSFDKATSMAFDATSRAVVYLTPTTDSRPSMPSAFEWSTIW